MKQVHAAQETVAKSVKVQREDDSVPNFDSSLPGMQENPKPADSKDPEDLKAALSNAPDGLGIANLFQLGTFGTEKDNAAKIIDKNSFQNSNASILQVTNRPDQLGAIWGNIDDGNYIDISKNQTLSMWLYFGRPTAIDEHKENKYVGDGMAFVLQNDTRGAAAISTFHKGLPDQRFGHGESLGVWGTDFDTQTELTSKQFAGTAIQQSYALEFDTFRDAQFSSKQINGLGNSFDLDLRGAQHIAMTYPDSAKTYRSDFSATGGFKRYFIMNHGDNVRDNQELTDASWHHITIDYNKIDDKLGTLTYKFNDKNLDGTPRNNPVTATNQINIDHFVLNGKTKLRWGFTGSTGTYFENNLISFESVPSFVNGEVTTELHDDTLNKDITSDSQKVTEGDSLTFKYYLKYLSGIKPWNNTVADINIPKNVTAKSISIKYADGSSANVPCDENQHHFNFELSNALKDHDPNNPHAIISVVTEVNPVSQTTKVGPEHSRFKSQYLIEDAESQGFTIDKPELNLKVVQPTGDAAIIDSKHKPTSMNVQYYVWESSQGWNSPKITVHAKVNSADKFTDYDPKVQSSTESDELTVPGVFHDGENSIYLYATDSNGNETPVKRIIYTVTDIGALVIGTYTNTVSFKDINPETSNQLVGRKGNWQLNIVDSRPLNLSDDKKNIWKLKAWADPLIGDKTHKKFNGAIIFKNPDGSILPLENQPQIIKDDGRKSLQGTQTTELVKTWTNDSGVLLKVNGSNNEDNYHGYIHWSLVNSI
jgi:hypothetical protein